MHFQWIHLHESEFPPFPTSDFGYVNRMRENAEWICRENSRLFMLLSRVHRTILMMLILPGSFLDCLPCGGREVRNRAEMRFVEYFSMAQSRHAMVSGRS